MKFSDKSLKQLRHRQNESIDKIYIIYKNPVPFKFQFIMDEYMKQICLKLGEISEEESKVLEKWQIKEITEQAVKGFESKQIKKYSTNID